MSSLTPEQQRAISIFLECYKNYSADQVIVVRDLTMDELVISDAKLFVEGRINRRTLPHQNHWAWNQSKSKVQFSLEGGGQVKFAKLNPRRVKTTDAGLPSYKLWVFEVESPNITIHSSLFFLWCEKGKTSVDADPPLVQETRGSKKSKSQDVQQPTEEITVDQFAFLADFIDPEIASQLGWITSSSPKSSYDNSPDTH